jgi:crotonobetainyl-CoA:carnitine CoA-transferase CaiB-like acyl-CoA transferase
MSATPLDPRRRAPLLGEHTEAVLRELGFTEAQILRLRG